MKDLRGNKDRGPEQKAKPLLELCWASPFSEVGEGEGGKRQFESPVEDPGPSRAAQGVQNEPLLGCNVGLLVAFPSEAPLSRASFLDSCAVHEGSEVHRNHAARSIFSVTPNILEGGRCIH